MSAICDICGGSRIMKNSSGVFECQDCGAKYSIEAMRLMMTGGITDSAPESVPVAIEYSSDRGNVPDEEADAVELDIRELLDKGAYSAANARYKAFIAAVREKGEKLDRPLLVFYGDFANDLDSCDFSSGLFGGVDAIFSMLAHSLDTRRFDGDYVVQSFVEAYTKVSNVCIARANKYIDISLQNAGFTQVDELDFNRRNEMMMRCSEARVAAQSAFNCYEDVTEIALRKLVIVVSDGTKLNNDSFYLLSEISDQTDSKLISKPGIAPAIRTIKNSLYVADPEKRRLLPVSGASQEELLSAARTLWQQRNYWLAVESFERANAISKTPEAVRLIALQHDFDWLVRWQLKSDEDKCLEKFAECLDGFFRDTEEEASQSRLRQLISFLDLVVIFASSCTYYYSELAKRKLSEEKLEECEKFNLYARSLLDAINEAASDAINRILDISADIKLSRLDFSELKEIYESMYYEGNTAIEKAGNRIIDVLVEQQCPESKEVIDKREEASTLAAKLSEVDEKRASIQSDIRALGLFKRNEKEKLQASLNEVTGERNKLADRKTQIEKELARYEIVHRKAWDEL